MTINRNARLSKLEAHLQRVGPGSVPRLLQCISAPRLSEIRLELLFGTAYQREQALRVLDYRNVARHMRKRY